MSETYAIRYADLGKIEQNLGRIREDLSAVHGNLSIVSENVKEAYAKIEFLSSEFQDFVQAQNRKNNLQIAHTELIRVRQELEKKYGHYDIVRRTTTGILQATDLSIVKKSTVSNASEKIMISTPGIQRGTVCILSKVRGCPPLRGVLKPLPLPYGASFYRRRHWPCPSNRR